MKGWNVKIMIWWHKARYNTVVYLARKQLSGKKVLVGRVGLPNWTGF
jgi:hypothetical protein